MTDCLVFEQQISALLDGELPEAERQALEAHLETCPDCMETYRMFSGLSAAIHDLSYEPPFDLKDRVLQQIEEEKITPIEEGRRFNWRRYAAVAAAFVVVAGVALFAGKDNIQQGAPAGIVFTNPPQASDVVRAVPEAAPAQEGSGNAIMAALPEDKSEEAVALLDDTTEAEAPGEATKPAAVAVTKDEEGEDVVTTLWIDGDDVVFTADGENYLRAENAAEELTVLLEPGE